MGLNSAKEARVPDGVSGHKSATGATQDVVILLMNGERSSLNGDNIRSVSPLIVVARLGSHNRVVNFINSHGFSSSCRVEFPAMVSHMLAQSLRSRNDVVAAADKVAIFLAVEINDYLLYSK